MPESRLPVLGLPAHTAYGKDRVQDQHKPLRLPSLRKHLLRPDAPPAAGTLLWDVLAPRPMCPLRQGLKPSVPPVEMEPSFLPGLHGQDLSERFDKMRL